MKKLLIENLGPRQFWNLRKDIVLDSYYGADYRNRYEINTEIVYQISQGFIEYIRTEYLEPASANWEDFAKYDTFQYWNEYRLLIQDSFSTAEFMAWHNL